MRLLLLALLSLLCISCASNRKSATLTSVEIKEIKPRFIEGKQFKRIDEYLTGKENTGKRVILRSDPETRTGYYFVLILDEKVRRLPAGTKIIGEFYTAKELGVQKHTFAVPAKRPKTKEIFIGLTGEDWPEGARTPAAWKFTIVDPNGSVMATEQSYLWSL
ncbi:MAG: hypothetical protein ACON4O_05890 [Lentimonas sp.]